MKQKKYWVVVGLVVLVVATAAATKLAGKKQIVEKKAYFAGTDLLLVPETIAVKTGEEFLVKLMVETKPVNGGDLAKVDFVETKLCYGSGLTIDSQDVKDKIMVGPTFNEVLSAKVAKEQDKWCLQMMLMSNKPDEKLGRGMVEAATIKFKGVADSSGQIEIDRAGTRISGFNPDQQSQDMALELGNIIGAGYQIGTGMETKTSCKFWDIFCWVSRLLGRN